MSSNDFQILTRFLLPIDGSDPSRRCVHFAGCLAAALGERIEIITLLHVMAGHYLTSHMTYKDARAGQLIKTESFRRIKEQFIEKSVMPMLKEAEEELRKTGVRIPVDCMVKDGRPAAVIEKVAREESYSTIIMGRRGLGPVEEIILGSTTSSLLHGPTPASIYVAGTLVQDGVCLLPRILIPLDGSPHALAAVEEAAVIAKSYGNSLKRIILLNCIDVAYYAEKADSGDKPEDEAAGILNQGRQILMEAGISEAKLETRAIYGKPADIVLDIADRKQITLVIMGRRGRSVMRDLFLGSVSSEILHRCMKPTVAIVGMRKVD